MGVIGDASIKVSAAFPQHLASAVGAVLFHNRDFKKSSIGVIFELFFSLK